MVEFNKTSILLAGHSHLSCLVKAHRENPERFLVCTNPAELEFIRLQSKVYKPNLVPQESRTLQDGDYRTKINALWQRARGKIERQIKALPQGGFRQMRMETNHLELSSDLKKRVRYLIRKRKPDWLVGVFMGNEYNALVLPQHPQPFDFHWPEMGFTFTDGAQTLPFEFVKLQLKELAEAHSLLFLREFRHLYSGRMAMLPPPPPIEDENHIWQFSGNFRKQIKKFGVSPAELRLKVYMLFVQVLAEECQKLDVEMVDLPFEVYELGFLKPCFTQQDPSHGNQEYGAILLKHLVDVLSKISKKGDRI